MPASRHPPAMTDFNPRSSCEERQAEHDGVKIRHDRISIHAPHARSDGSSSEPYLPASISIHAPHARSDAVEMVMGRLSKQFQSTLLMRGATELLRKYRVLTDISIHAPHARSDLMLSSKSSNARHFNPRSSCEERRGERGKPSRHHRISIHAPHARSDEQGTGKTRTTLISIHAPHARSDVTDDWTYYGKYGKFQSTLLMRGATCCLVISLT